MARDYCIEFYRAPEVGTVAPALRLHPYVVSSIPPAPYLAPYMIRALRLELYAISPIA